MKQCIDVARCGYDILFERGTSFQDSWFTAQSRFTLAITLTLLDYHKRTQGSQENTLCNVGDIVTHQPLLLGGLDQCEQRTVKELNRTQYLPLQVQVNRLHFDTCASPTDQRKCFSALQMTICRRDELKMIPKLVAYMNIPQRVANCCIVLLWHPTKRTIFSWLKFSLYM